MSLCYSKLLASWGQGGLSETLQEGVVHSETIPECSREHKLQHIAHNTHQYMLSSACPGKREMSSKQ